MQMLADDITPRRRKRRRSVSKSGGSPSIVRDFYGRWLSRGRNERSCASFTRKRRKGQFKCRDMTSFSSFPSSITWYSFSISFSRTPDTVTVAAIAVDVSDSFHSGNRSCLSSKLKLNHALLFLFTRQGDDDIDLVFVFLDVHGFIKVLVKDGVGI